jgi:alpha-L-rhamnosidase
MSTIERLRTEGLKNPIGLGEPSPRFTWEIISDQRDLSQTESRIVVKSDDQDVWDSGWRRNTWPRAEYLGPALAAGTQYSWHVQSRLSDGTEVISELAHFETSRSEILGSWIRGHLVGGPRATVPVPRFRKYFPAENDVKSARLVVTALGIYDIHINGIRAHDDLLSPGWTDYRKRIRFQTYDVTELVQAGENLITVDVADGWYCGFVEWRGRQLYGDFPGLRLDLIIQSDAGETIVSTDETWAHAYGTIVQADLLMGEHHDYRLEYGPWLPAEVFQPKIGLLVPNLSERVRVTQRLQPASIRKISRWPRDLHIVDFGQNLVGTVRLRVAGEPGTTVRVRHGERLDVKGNLYTENLRTAQQTNYITLGTNTPEWFEPKFTFHGFQYVEVENYPGELTPNDIEALVIHTDYELTGDFTCSDPLVTQLWKNIRWGWRGNSVDVPTDCPQRDERLGWTGDAQVFVRTATILADVQNFFEKYQVDLADAQYENGAIPPTAPTTEFMPGTDGGPGWSDATLICPYTLYNITGDDRILHRHYETFRRYFAYLESAAINDIRSHPNFNGFKGFGDWLNINAETPHDLIGTAFFAYDAHLLSEICRVIGNEERAKYYRNRFFEIREAFLRRFITDDGLSIGGTQTAYLLGLHFDLLPDDQRTAAMDALVEDIGKRGYKLSTGFVGSPYLNEVLTINGRPDIAFRLLHQTDWPSWLYAVTQGATTIWERWDGWTHDKGFQDKGMNSFNHYAYGAIGDWLVRYVAGIELTSPGFQTVKMQPTIGGNISWVKCSQRCPFGVIRSSWENNGSLFRWEVSIPVGVSAELICPGTSIHVDGKPYDGTPIGSGSYVVSSTLNG